MTSNKNTGSKMLPRLFKSSDKKGQVEENEEEDTRTERQKVIYSRGVHT
jgi:hypothetical protein